MEIKTLTFTYPQDKNFAHHRLPVGFKNFLIYFNKKPYLNYFQ